MLARKLPDHNYNASRATRNLAIANRSRVSSAYKVTTVNFQGGFKGEEAYGRPVAAATAQAGVVCHGQETSVTHYTTVLHYTVTPEGLTENREIYIPTCIQRPAGEPHRNFARCLVSAKLEQFVYHTHSLTHCCA